MNENKQNILIVDDTPANLQLLAKMLTEEGFSIRPASNGKLALKAAKNSPPDLVLLDIQMSEMDGFEVCREFKNDEQLQEIPIIFISALNETRDKIKAFNSGGVDYITKPFQQEEVMARVNTHLKIRRFQLQLQKALDDLKKAEVHLVQSEKMAALGVLTAGIAHEINNPINFISSGIVGLSKLLNNMRRAFNVYEKITPENVSGQLQEIEKLKTEIEYDDLLPGTEKLMESIRVGTERTTDIVEGLRTFSRLDEKDKKFVDVHKNIDSTLMLLSKQYQEFLTIRKAYGNVPSVLCFPGKINQVFMNILMNAIDAVKESIEISESKPQEIGIKTSISKRNGKQYLEVDITDTGTGIKKVNIQHLFEPFFTTKEIGKGTGLGLSISYNIIQDHNGFLDVESEEGIGTTFKIFLPLDL
jgi:two-component system NtrC family sensor kinase